MNYVNELSHRKHREKEGDTERHRKRNGKRLK